MTPFEIFVVIWGSGITGAMAFDLAPRIWRWLHRDNAQTRKVRELGRVSDDWQPGRFPRRTR